jgi:hypothetical protein
VSGSVIQCHINRGHRNHHETPGKPDNAIELRHNLQISLDILKVSRPVDLKTSGENDKVASPDFSDWPTRVTKSVDCADQETYV